MALEIPGFSFTLESAADFTGSQFRFVDCNSSGKAALPSAAGARVVGVRQNKPNTGQATTIVQSGVSLVEAGAAITAGASVQTDANGKAITAASTKLIVGIALKSAGADGEVIPVLLVPGAAAA